MRNTPRFILLALPIVALPFAFIFDVIHVSVDLGSGLMVAARDLAIPGSFVAVFLFMESRRSTAVPNVPKAIGRLLVINVGLLFLFGLLSLLLNFFPSDHTGIAFRQASTNIFGAYLFGSVATVVSIVTLQQLRGMVLFKRTRNVVRNFGLYVVTTLLAASMSFRFLGAQGSVVETLLFVLAVILAALNSFRQGWIVYLSRREKLYALTYAGLLFFAFLIADIALARHSNVQRALALFSPVLLTFVQLNALFGTFYVGMSFVSTLFHLPTAEVFERKQSELNSLHNLGRLVTQVFDYDDLVKTVIHMAAEVTGAKGAWLELFDRSEATGELTVRVVARMSVTDEFIDAVGMLDDPRGGGRLRDARRPIVMEDLGNDKRTRWLKERGIPRTSLLCVPLQSHGELSGVLYVVKDGQQTIDQEDIDVMTGFADHATIAIENSRLIARSIERERLQQEIMVAQRMQRRLLPQRMPHIPGIDLAAVSESSTEVGGDYYDVFALADGSTGIVVADVAGKGVSAAFYMAELKGIFLSLTRVCNSPKELLHRANAAILESLEKNAFISVVYATLNPASGLLVFARAGHCPVVYVTDGGAELIRPTGIGLGLADDELFLKSTEERRLALRPGDVCVLYTDGITEARNAAGEEYGYDRLVQMTKSLRNGPAERIKEGILEDVRTFVGGTSYTDDMTLVVVKRTPGSGNETHQEGEHHHD